MKFNISHIVRVKLTERGRRILAEMTFPHAVEEDSEGFSEWQLWVLMETFGPHIHLGSDLCFETEIDIIEGQA